MQPTKLRETQNQPSYHQSTPNRKLISHHCKYSHQWISTKLPKPTERNPSPAWPKTNLHPSLLDNLLITTRKSKWAQALPDLGHRWWKREARENRDKDRERDSPSEKKKKRRRKKWRSNPGEEMKKKRVDWSKGVAELWLVGPPCVFNYKNVIELWVMETENS